MFITGPDVVKTVTGEDVTVEELGGAMTHATKSGVCHLRRRRREERASTTCATCCRSCPPTTWRSRRSLATDDPADRLCPELTEIMPPSSNQPYDMKKVIAAVVDDGDFFEYAPLLGPEHRVRLRPPRRPRRRHRRQPAPGAGRRARHRLLGEGGPLRAHVRRLQHPARHLRRRPRLPARHRPGVRRHHPPRRQAALRLLRGDRAPRPDHHPQGLRRRLRRHELQVDRLRPRLRVAVGRARGDGPGRARSRSSTAGSWPRPTTPWPARPSCSRSTPSATCNPYDAAERGYVDDVIDPADTRKVLVDALDLLRSKREDLPKRKHGNVPL